MHARTRVLLLSGAGNISVAAARAVGASGFVPKSWSAGDIARAVRTVALGGEVFEPDVSEPGVTLSDREREVLAGVAAGQTNREIAAELFLSPTRSRSTRARCTASSRCETGPRRCSGHSGSGCS